jgi:hypothetical protein
MVTWKLKASTFVPAFNVGGSPHAVVERRHRSPMANSSSKKPYSYAESAGRNAIVSRRRKPDQRGPPQRHGALPPSALSTRAAVQKIASSPRLEGSIMNFRLSLAGRGVNTIRLFAMVCFIFGIISLIHTCTTTQQPPSAESFTTEHRASASTIASQDWRDAINSRCHTSCGWSQVACGGGLGLVDPVQKTMLSHSPSRVTSPSSR